MSRAKAKGTRFESALVRYLRAGLEDDRVERRALSGSKDMGDLHHLFAHGSEGIVEAKSHKTVTFGKVSEWREQTLDERENADADFALLIVDVYGSPIGRSKVHVTIRDFARICLGMNVVRSSSLSELYDDVWVVMTLDDAIRLMRGV